MAPGKGQQQNKTKLGKSLLRRRKRDLESISKRHTTLEAGSGGPQSITEMTSIDEFLSNAQAEERSFEAESARNFVLAQGTLRDEIEEMDEEILANFCSVPKKPHFSLEDTAETFQHKELDAFLAWKRSLALLQEANPKLPPFEKNLDFWRQLWTIIELSDVVVQVVDARDPLFFASKDLEEYVLEVDQAKVNVLLLNKADLLTEKQRKCWSEYFRKQGSTRALFFAATLEQEKDSDSCQDFDILEPKQLLNKLQAMVDKPTVTVGFTGYPNVGKSSTINRFLTSKKLQVSATPGKTKHFQTHLVGGSCVFIDGPGLVIPNLTMTKASMILAGILPIDNLTDYKPPMNLLLEKLPAKQLTKHYGISATCVTEARHTDRKGSPSHLFLTSYGLMRGIMKQGGVADQARAARTVLKDYVLGKLLFCKAPPAEKEEEETVNQQEFFPLETDETVLEEDMSLEESFPELRLASGVHQRGVKRPEDLSKKKKKEKVRRVFNENPYK